MADLTTLANVKQWLNISTTTDDALLSRMITALSNYVQSWLNRQLLSAAYTDRISGNGISSFIAINNYPLTAISSVSIAGQAIPLSTDGITAGYLFDQRGVYFLGYALVKGIQNITINYTAGYSATPPELEQALIELIGLRYRERTRIGEVSKSIGGEVVSYSVLDFPASVQTILNNYKRVTSVY